MTGPAPAPGSSGTTTTASRRAPSAVTAATESDAGATTARRRPTVVRCRSSVDWCCTARNIAAVIPTAIVEPVAPLSVPSAHSQMNTVTAGAERAEARLRVERDDVRDLGHHPDRDDRQQDRPRGRGHRHAVVAQDGPAGVEANAELVQRGVAGETEPRRVQQQAPDDVGGEPDG